MDGSTKNRGLSDLRKDVILAQLGSGKTVAQVCREMGCNPNHVHGWLKSYDGLQRLESSLRDARLLLENRLPSLIEKSLNVIDATLTAPFMTPEKLAAAKLVVQVVAKLSTPQNCTLCDRDRTIT